MKYITLEGKTYHLARSDINFVNVKYAYCGKFALYKRIQDKVYSKVPPGRLCKNCKQQYLKYYTEQDLMLELL